MTDRFDVNRREFVKKAAAAGAVTVGTTAATGSAVADSTPASQERAESVLSAHGEGVLSLLESEGVLEDRTELPTAVGNDYSGVAKGHEGAAEFSLSDGSTELHVVTDVEAGTLTVTVRPEDDRAFAILDTGDDLVGYSMEDGVYDFEAQADCTCTSYLCDGTRSEKCCGDYECYYFCNC